MKKILLSLSMIAVVAVLVLGATGAFFSDTETSTGNTFTAGAIDLTVDSTQHYNNAICVNSLWQLEPNTTATVPQYPVIGSECGGTWVATDLGASNKFFNFADIKPGDSGENTISLHVLNNDAWACVDVNVTKNADVTSTEPELAAPDVQADPNSITDGELAQNLYFTAWADDGDNIWESGEPLLFSNHSGPASDVLGGKTYALADSTTGTPLTGAVTKNIGLAWCAGTQTVNTGNHTITCDGSTMGNNTQTDSMEASVAFRVVQSRNNADFKCSDSTQGENGHQETIVLSNPTDYDTLSDNTKSKIGSGSWKNDNDFGPGPNADKTELYVYSSSNPGVLGTFTVDDIKSISYSTNKPDAQSDPDFYYTVYTEKDGIDDGTWYGYRLNMEPYYSNSLNAPANVWNTWNTNVGTNESTFFDTAKTAGGFGFYGQPSLSEIQAGTINWSTYNGAYSNQNIDYGVENVKYISFQTGTGWDISLTGSIDEIVIELMNGNKLTIDLEPAN